MPHDPWDPTEGETLINIAKSKKCFSKTQKTRFQPSMSIVSTLD